MNVLLRGDTHQRLRLASGLILFIFAGTHFFNHALGLVSLEAMHQAQQLRLAVTRSTAGTVILIAALVTHLSLGLYKLALRRTLRMPLWEALQILIALSIPFLLFPHIVNTRIAHVFFDVNDSYLYELARLWPDRAVLQSLLLVLVWSHGCIGLHFWLRLSDRYDRARIVLWPVAALVPVLGIAGFAVSGQTTAEIMSDPDALAQLKQRSNWPNAIDGATMAQLRDLTQYLFGTLLVVLFGYRALRAYRSRGHREIEISYRDGPTVRVAPGLTLLEISRAHGVPHASVCGGRARCFTCRVRIEEGLKRVPEANSAEALALRLLEAPPNVRLACQMRPTAPMAISILNKPAVPGPLQVDFVEVKSVVTAHARAVLSNEVTEIESSDPTTITRWFSGKVDFPVHIPAFPTDECVLRGARLDYLQGQPSPAIVFSCHGNTVSLHVVPSGNSDAVAVRANRGGYSVVGWSDDEFAYLATSDIDRDALDALQDRMAEAKAFPPGAATLEALR